MSQDLESAATSTHTLAKGRTGPKASHTMHAQLRNGIIEPGDTRERCQKALKIIGNQKCSTY